MVSLLHVSYVFACVWSLSSVCPHMDSKIPSKWKCFITLVANIWFLTSVYLWMYLKVTFSWEISITLAVFIWFLFGVSSQMHSKDTLSLSSGFVTCIWFLPSVFSKMPYKTSIPSKRPIKLAACIWLSLVSILKCFVIH